MRKNVYSDLLFILVWILATFIFIIVPVFQDSIVRKILGIFSVLFIPGYVLVAALFPKNDDLDNIERAALSFGLSIAIVPLIGLLLNYTFGIKLIPILIGISIYSITLDIIALYRREKLPEDKRFTVSFKKIFKNVIIDVNNQNKTDRILTGILFLVIILSTIILVYIITVPKIGEKFTEFYILNSSSGKADNYPTNLKFDVYSNIKIGIVNHEYAIVNYTVHTVLDRDILASEDIMLGNNQTWEKNITLVPNKVGSDMKLEFLLFRDYNFTNPYRNLHLTVNVT